MLDSSLYQLIVYIYAQIFNIKNLIDFLLLF